MPPLDLDDFDRRILRLLQQDATLSTQDLAQAVGLSPSPCWRRVRRMQEAGLISGQVALVNRAALGLSALAYIHVTLIDHTEASIARFNDFVQRHPQIVECATITGADDYMLKVVAEGPEALEHFLMREMLALGLVRSSTTHFALRQVKLTTALPV
ncbi:Lrp/AsnC family transcriptional regulator [Gemmobacter denitrificans]|uniref:Lrp/AsnC family transcriptional regulator n=1 Tax=Gemmobacter denitrificans TaxID=3123040 RepID=A0ABU8BTI1_9RHOB